MSLIILTVGKKHEAWVKDGIERYQSRLRAPYDVKWEIVPHSSLSDVAARQEESKAILKRIGGGFAILLDEVGKNIDSPAFSTILSHAMGIEDRSADLKSAGLSSVINRPAGDVTVIIGGAYGVDGSVHERADFVWSLSKLVFPHQLVRLILLEQIYRAQQISAGSGYHHS